MKKQFKSYISFTRFERAGLMGLCALLLLLIGIRATMYLWASPADNTEKDKRLSASWATFKDSKQINDSGIVQKKKDYEDALTESSAPLPEQININTVDSATLVRLKGIGPATASKIIARRKEKPFTSISQLLEVRRFPDATFKILKAHLVTGP